MQETAVRFAICDDDKVYAEKMKALILQTFQLPQPVECVIYLNQTAGVYQKKPCRGRFANCRAGNPALHRAEIQPVCVWRRDGSRGSSVV